MHEAGHAVVALTETMAFDKVVLAATERTKGMLVGLRGGSRHDDDVVRVALAGIAADRMSAARWDHRIYQRAADDIASVVEFYRRPGASTTALRWNVEQVARVLRGGWGAVEALAARLLREREVGFEAAREIVAATSGARRAPSGRTPDGVWTPLIELVEARVAHPATAALVE